MRAFSASNINAAYEIVIPWLLENGIEEDSRNGKVLRAREPVSICYQHPMERVLFDPNRDANPFFHLMEAIWMLAGRRDSEWISFFNSQMAEYANADGNYHGAYGHRWRRHFDLDQIKEVIGLLQRTPTTRRAVISMWDPRADLTESPDLPCNTTIYFSIVDHALNMMVCNRSNDAVWGALGANAVHMSILQEYVAASLNVAVGRYWQVTNNLHIYTDVPKVWAAVNNRSFLNYYEEVSAQRLCDYPGCFILECEEFCKGESGFANSFLTYTAHPMRIAWRRYKKDNDILGALYAASRIQAPDWRLACLNWLNRRNNAN